MVTGCLRYICFLYPYCCSRSLEAFKESFGRFMDCCKVDMRTSLDVSEMVIQEVPGIQGTQKQLRNLHRLSPI